MRWWSSRKCFSTRRAIGALSSAQRSTNIKCGRIPKSGNHAFNASSISSSKTLWRSWRSKRSNRKRKKKLSYRRAWKVFSPKSKIQLQSKRRKRARRRLLRGRGRPCESARRWRKILCLTASPRLFRYLLGWGLLLTRRGSWCSIFARSMSLTSLEAISCFLNWSKARRTKHTKWL